MGARNALAMARSAIAGGQRASWGPAALVREELNTVASPARVGGFGRRTSDCRGHFNSRDVFNSPANRRHDHAFEAQCRTDEKDRPTSIRQFVCIVHCGSRIED